MLSRHQKNSILTINSAIIFSLAFVVTIVLHELAHALAQLAMGLKPVLYHVMAFPTLPMTDLQKAIEAAAGPLFSLIQGMILWYVFKISSKKPFMMRLLILWLSLLGFSEFFGYLLITPFSPEMDTGVITTYMKIPLLVQYIISAFALYAILRLGLISRLPFLSFVTNSQEVKNVTQKRNFALKIAIYPWLISATIISLLLIPAPYPFAYFLPFTLGIFLITMWGNIDKIEKFPSGTEKEPGAIHWNWLIVLIIMLILFRFVLARGIAL